MVSEVLVSASLFKEDENNKQRPIFFIRKSPSEAETRYTSLEQAALALHVAAKKLRPYFQAHLIIVLTNLPLRSYTQAGPIGKDGPMAIELSEFSIQYKPRLALKGQLLADFLAEIPQRDGDLNNVG